MRYHDRRHAGAVLAGSLSEYTDAPDVVALGLVRGGVPVAAEIAARLRVPLDALVIRKLGVPWAPEVAFGALGPGGVRVYNERIAGRLSIAEIDEVTARESAELSRREHRYRAGRPPLDLSGRVALLVDDGLATGATARAAVLVARALSARRVVLAVPVGARSALDHLATLADDVVCPARPGNFDAVSRWYDDFEQVADADVVAALAPRPGP